MKLQNAVGRPLTVREEEAIRDAAEVLERGFGRIVYAATAKTDFQRPAEPFGVTFTFLVAKTVPRE